MALFKNDNYVPVAYGMWGPISAPYRADKKPHGGRDIHTKGNPTAYSQVDGFVEYSGMISQASGDVTWQWGWHVRIFEGQGDAIRRRGTRRHVLAHNERNMVNTGHVVRKGQPVCIMGDSGNAKQDSQGKHVHYQVDEWNGSRWVNIDPTPWTGGENAISATGKVWYGESEDNMTYLLELKDGGNNQLFSKPDPDTKYLVQDHATNGLYAVIETEVSGVPVVDAKWCKIMYGDSTAYAVYGGVVANRAMLLEPSQIARKYGSPLKLQGDCAAIEAKLAATEEALSAEKLAAAAAIRRAENAEKTIQNGRKVVIIDNDI